MVTQIVPTAAVADAAVRLGVQIRSAPAALVPIFAGAVFTGPAAPITHLGSVDVLLETIDDAPRGAVMVVDNGGRLDEACVGDLITLEAKLAGLAGIIIWSLHRDTAQLRQIGLPLHSLGATSFGPRRVPPAGTPMRSAFFDGASVTDEDWVFGDDDGVLFVGPDHRSELLELAATILSTETAQSTRMSAGTSLRAQVDFDGYRAKQAADPSMTLRRHLVEQGGAVET